MASCDLTTDEAVLFLLADTSWRLRRIEHLDLFSATRYRLVTRHYLELPEDVPRLVKDRPIRARLPVGRREKQPLLNFIASCAGGTSAQLVPLGTNTKIQAKRLVALRDAAGLDPAALPHWLLLAICQHVPGQWREFRRHRWSAGPAREITRAMEAYLGAFGGLAADTETVARWRGRCAHAAPPLAAVLGEDEDLCSSSENVLLAVAHADHYLDADDVEGVVGRYADAVASAAQRDDPHAYAFLRALATYGRRWEMMLDVDLEPGRLATIRVEEDRLFELEGRLGSTVVHRVVHRESRSIHVDAVATDHTIAVADLSLRDQAGRPVTSTPLVEDGVAWPGAMGLVRASGDTATAYAAGKDPPEQVDFRVRLRPIRDIRWPPLGAIAVTALAIYFAATTDATDRADTLAVIVVPATVGAAFAVVREQSTLAMRLQRWPNFILGLAIVALWLVAALRVL
jgi:hypothetical protein